jgi:hypothetical protein
MSDRPCDACGLSAGDSRTGKLYGTTQIRTTNGSLFLCEQCLGDINRKNPITKALLVALRTAISEAERPFVRHADIKG